MRYFLLSLILSFAANANEHLRITKPLSEQEMLGTCKIMDVKVVGNNIFLWLEKNDGDFRRLDIPGTVKEKVKNDTIRYSFKTYRHTGIPFGDSVVRTRLTFTLQKGLLIDMKEVSYETFYNLSVERKTFDCSE